MRAPTPNHRKTGAGAPGPAGWPRKVPPRAAYGQTAGLLPAPRQRGDGSQGPASTAPRRRRTWAQTPAPGASGGEGGRCGRGRRLLPEHGPRRPQAGDGSPRSRGWGSGAAAPRTGGAAGTEGGGAGQQGVGWGPGTLPAHPAHRASVLNDDLLGQHDTAVRGPFLLLPLGHFTILESWRCCCHSRGGRPPRRVPSRHYYRAEPLGVPAAIFRARPASGGASHRAIGDEPPGPAP